MPAVAGWPSVDLRRCGMRSSWLVLCLLAAPSVARAQASVTVQLSPEGEQLAQQLGVSAADLANQLKTQIDGVYQTANVDGYLRAFADATSFSARGIGVDYASAPTGFLAGLAINVAAAGQGNVRSDERPTAGLAANLAVMVGMNLAQWDHPRWTIFANGFYRDAAMERLDGSITSAGAHVQYTLIPASGNDRTGTALRWLGLTVTSGLELTSWRLGGDDEDLANELGVGTGANSTEIALDARGRFDLSASALTIPLEVTTAIRVALLASVYVGAGIDLTAGKSSLDASLTGTMTTSDGRAIGTTAITASGESTTSPGTGRILAGVQLNLWKLKVFAQVNASQTPAVSAGLGFKFVQ